MENIFLIVSVLVNNKKNTDIDPKSLSSAGKLLYFSLTEHRCQASCHILSGEIQQMDMTAELQFALALTLHIQGVTEMTWDCKQCLFPSAPVISVRGV